MGRGVQLEPQIDAGHLRATFTIGANSGALIRVSSARGDLVGESATYRDGDGVLRVRLTYQGKRRSMTAAKIGWILATGAHPKGQVTTIGAEDDFRLENLTLVRNCAHRPWERGGGQASALQRRAEVDFSLLAAMAGQPGAGVMQLAKLVGIGEGRISVKLNRLAERGLAASPMCVPGRSWALTDQGREIAAAGRPLIDDLDRDILRALALTAMGPVRLSRRLGVCLQTTKRRTISLAEKGLVIADVRRFFSITPEGIEALGPKSQPSPRWVNVAAISAAAAKDVADRPRVDDRTQEERSRPGKMARAAARLNKSSNFNGHVFSERMAEAS